MYAENNKTRWTAIQQLIHRHFLATWPLWGGLTLAIVAMLTLDQGFIGLVCAILLVLLFGQYYARRQVDTERERLMQALGSVSEGFVWYDENDRLILCNQHFQKLNEPIAEYLAPGTAFIDLVRAQLNQELIVLQDTTAEQWLATRLQRHREPGEPFVQQYSNGRWIQISEHCTRDGGCVGVYVDITSHIEAEERLQYMAEHDALTGLPNRMMYRDRLQQLLNRIYRSHDKHSSGAVLMLDLDHFKDINDTLGHLVGDKLLQILSERLRGIMGTNNMIARIGGDEFAIVCPDAQAVAGLIRQLSAIFEEPIQVDEHVLHTSASIGIALFPKDGRNADELIKNADMALYLAKAHGRSSVCRYYSQELGRQVQERKRILVALREAIANSDFELHYQPQIKLANRRIVHAEALIRWRPSDFPGGVSPALFIPIAETSGLIEPLGDWTLWRACRDTRYWLDLGVRDMGVSVNLSPAQLNDPDLVAKIEDILAQTTLSARHLELEITETAVMDDHERAIEVMRRLNELGIKLAIDDFGTGYSSLSYLKRLPVQRLKIDASFVRDLETNPDDAAIVKAIVRLGQSLDLEVVAEGVENEHQLDYLDAQGCDFVQGFYYGRPESGEQLLRRLRP